MSEYEPLVSVIIPNYNRERSIALCLESLRAQTYPRIEIVVVDDHSTDASPRIAADLGLTVLTTPVNSGPPVARNIGVAYSRGEVLFFLDSDVALAPDAVAEAVRALGADPRVGALSGLLGPEPLLRQRRIQEYRAMQLHCWFYRHEGETVGHAIHTALFAVRRAVYDEIGPLNPELRHHDGGEYGHRLAAAGYRVCATAAVTGRKDSDSTLGIVLSKVFKRAREHARERWPGAPLAGASGRVLASALTVAAVPLVGLVALAGPAGLLAPLALLAGAVALDAGTFRFVLGRRGPGFGLYFTGVQLLFNVVSAVGGGVGTLERRLAGRPPGPGRGRIEARSSRDKDAPSPMSPTRG
jgi:hypothetical protein